MEIEHRPRNPSLPNINDIPVLPRTDSTSEFMPVDDKEVEYFFASDASAVIEHTNRVIYLEVRKKIQQIVVKFRCNWIWSNFARFLFAGWWCSCREGWPIEYPSFA